jgi:hypothetical protein
LTSIVIWGGFYHDIIESAQKAKESYLIRGKLDEIRNQNIILIAENDSLKENMVIIKSDMGNIKDNNRRLTSLLEPFIERAKLRYPEFEDQEALKKLASDVAKMQPKMEFLENRTRSWVDNSKNLFHTVYFFRSQYSVGVWDVSIKLAFDKPFILVNADIHGGFVVEQGSRLAITPDSTGFSFTTLHLREGNYIKIEIESQESIKIVSMDLQP